MRYLGMFYAREPGAMMGLHDAPYATMGRHALCAWDMACDGGAMAMVNGRIENEQALCEKLNVPVPCACGGACFARLLLSAYRMWGEDYPSYLRGSASGVVIDQDANRLVISRDRVGLTPVYYAARASSVVFSDAYAPVLRAPFVEPVIDAAGLCELLAMNPLFSPGRTPLRDVMRLEPGCTLVSDGRGCRVKRYFDWSARDTDDAGGDVLPRGMPHGALKLPQTPSGAAETKPDTYFPGGAADDFLCARARDAARGAGEAVVTTGARTVLSPPPYAPSRAAHAMASALLPEIRSALDLPAYAAARYHEAAAAWAGETARGRLARAMAVRWTLPRQLERAYALLGQYALTLCAPYADERYLRAILSGAGGSDPPDLPAEPPVPALPEGAGQARLSAVLSDPEAPVRAFLDPARASAMPDETQFLLARADQWMRFHGARLEPGA